MINPFRPSATVLSRALICACLLPAACNQAPADPAVDDTASQASLPGEQLSQALSAILARAESATRTAAALAGEGSLSTALRTSGRPELQTLIPDARDRVLGITNVFSLILGRLLAGTLAPEANIASIDGQTLLHRLDSLASSISATGNAPSEAHRAEAVAILRDSMPWLTSTAITTEQHAAIADIIAKWVLQRVIPLVEQRAQDSTPFGQFAHAALNVHLTPLDRTLLSDALGDPVRVMVPPAHSPASPTALRLLKQLLELPNDLRSAALEAIRQTLQAG